MKLQPVSTIKAELGIDKGGAIEKFFTYTCYRYMDDFVPMDNGDLRRDVDIGNDYITYENNYAEIQYYGIIHGHRIPEENYTTPRNRTVLG